MDQRLTLIQEMVRPCGTIADVGTDHGLLVCGLVSRGIAQRGIATDINPLPLEKARREIALQGLSDRIVTVLTDGLRGISLACNDGVVIAGMGGELIARILGDWWQCAAVSHDYYLQPMTKPERLRSYLYQSGFQILEEHCCIAGGRPYSVLHARFGGAPHLPSPTEQYLGRIDPGAGPAEAAYCHKLARQLEKRLDGIATNQAYRAEAAQLRQVVDEITRRLEHEGQADL